MTLGEDICGLMQWGRGHARLLKNRMDTGEWMELHPELGRHGNYKTWARKYSRGRRNVWDDSEGILLKWLQQQRLAWVLVPVLLLSTIM